MNLRVLFDVGGTCTHVATMTSSGDELLEALASGDPVLIVDDDDDERIVASNLAARTLFGLDETALHAAPLSSLLPNVVARSIAIDATHPPAADTFVRAWARSGRQLEPVTVGAVRGPVHGAPRIAVFVRIGDDRTRLNFALEAARIGEWDLDLRNNTLVRSRLHAANFGYADATAEWGYEQFLAHIHEDDRKRVDVAFHSALAGDREFDVEFSTVWPDGTRHRLWAKGRTYRDPEGAPIRFAGIVVDISERARTEERERLSALAMAATADGIVIADARSSDFPIVYANHAFEAMTGYASSELIGRNCRFLQGSDRDQPELEHVRQALAHGRACRVTMRNYRKDGTLFWNQLTLSPVRDEMGLLSHFVGVQSDVTRHKEFEAELLYRATHDPLTGLPNHQLVEERLEEALRDADREGTIVAVAFVDIDRLKRVNDSLGHAGGDIVIRAVASRLREAVRPIDTVARYGGDEFVVVYPALENAAAAERLVSVLRGNLGVPIDIGGIELVPSASVGVALYPQDAVGVSHLISVADTAMYAVKAADRGNYRFFDRRSMPPRPDRLALEIDLQRALAVGEFRLVYQPIYAAVTGGLTALEALLRWQHPVRGEVGPNDFVPLAEESGLIVPIGAWVVREICRQHHVWKEHGLPLVPMTVNVSIAQFRRGDFPETFKRILEEERVDPKYIVLEITESIVMDNAELFVAMLGEMRANGTRMSIDDFGTGFSSLRYLQRLSLDAVKIDKSFVDTIAHDPTAAAICQAIVTMAHSVGLTAVAEGIETKAQVDKLIGMGCDGLQGFFFARPMGGDECEEILRRGLVHTA